MHYFEFQRVVNSSLPLPTQEGIAAKRARTHGEWSCIVACFPVKIGFSVFNVVVNIFLFSWRYEVVSGQKGLFVDQRFGTGN